MEFFFAAIRDSEILINLFCLIGILKLEKNKILYISMAICMFRKVLLISKELNRN